MTDKELKYMYDFRDVDVKTLREMIRATERAEMLGFKIKDKLYFDDKTYYGKIFRFFSVDDMDSFFDDSKINQYPDFFTRACETEKRGFCRGMVVEGKITWE